MDKLKLLSDVIIKCNNYIENYKENDFEAAMDFVYRTCNTYSPEIPNIGSCVSYIHESNLVDNLTLLKEIIENKIANLKLDNEKRKHELALAKLKCSSLNVTQTQNNKHTQKRCRYK